VALLVLVQEHHNSPHDVQAAIVFGIALHLLRIETQMLVDLMPAG